MPKPTFSFLLVFQLLVTFVVLFAIYMIIALLDILQLDMIGMIGFVIFQPLLGILLSAVTLFLCLVIGLPIRLIEKLRLFWIENFWITFLLLGTGALLLILSFSPQYTVVHLETIDDHTVERHIPNAGLALSGWFLVAFALLHFYPQRMLTWVNRKLLSRRTS